MIIRSLGRRTDLIFARFSGSVVDKGAYTLIQTPGNPAYHWGNYIVFDHVPHKGSLKAWKAIFNKEFHYYSEPHHYVFTWDTAQNGQGECQEFLAANFELSSASVLTASNLNPPARPNDRVQTRKVTSDDDWAQVIRLQSLCADPKFINAEYVTFKQRQMADYRKMSELGKGSWFGAFLDGQLVGDLGIFYEGQIGRYQNVGTHPNYRQQGICGTLVYRAGLLALDEFGLDTLVMEADVDYHAARIYESVGFKGTEVNCALSWWRGKDQSAKENGASKRKS